MKPITLEVGFIALVDAAPVILAHELGFASEEGISLALRRAISWSELRDMLSFGYVDAAHMLAPVPVATALGLGGGGVALEAVSVLSVNGNVIGVSRELAARMRSQGHDFAFNDATSAGQALIAASDKTLRVGVPFPFSMHAELVFYWLNALGLPAPQGLDVRTIPPARMADAIEAGEVDAFCVGEPWGSQAVENSVGELVLPASSIWSFAPEKVLAVRADWAKDEPELRDRLVRAVWRAGRWLSNPQSRSLTAEILSRPAYLDVPSEIIERALTGQLLIAPDGTSRHVPGFVEFHHGSASFPWRSQAEWIGRQLAQRTGLDLEASANSASSVFRSDLFRDALLPTHADLPGASSKLEGAVEMETPVASSAGQLILSRNAFFDGRVFEPLRK